MYSRSVPTLARESFGKGKERERGSLDVMRNWIKRDKDNAVATLESRPKRLKNRTKIRVKIEGKGGEGEVFSVKIEWENGLNLYDGCIVILYKVQTSFGKYRRLEKAPRDIKIKSQVKGSMRLENFTTFLILEKRSLLREITNIRLGMSAPLGLRSLNVYYTFVYYTRYCYYRCYFRTNQ